MSHYNKEILQVDNTDEKVFLAFFILDWGCETFVHQVIVVLLFFIEKKNVEIMRVGPV